MVAGEDAVACKWRRSTSGRGGCGEGAVAVEESVAGEDAVASEGEQSFKS